MISLDHPRVTYDTAKLSEDIAAKGWFFSDLAKRAGVSNMTVTRFLRGEHQTNPTAKKLSRALGYSVRRYIISDRSEAVSV